MGGKAGEGECGLEGVEGGVEGGGRGEMMGRVAVYGGRVMRLMRLMKSRSHQRHFDDSSL